jgi:hypothetical protein
MTSESPRTFLRSAPIISPRLRHTHGRSCVHPPQIGVHANLHLIISPRLRHTHGRSCVHPPQSGVHANLHLPPPLASQAKTDCVQPALLVRRLPTAEKSKNGLHESNQPVASNNRRPPSRNSSCLDCDLQQLNVVPLLLRAVDKW